MMELYHVTNKKYLENIMKEGLVPDIGPLAGNELIRPMPFVEPRRAVFFFKELDEAFMQDVNTWMTRVHKREDMALLKVTLPDDFGVLTPGLPDYMRMLEERYGWEVLSYITIPPEYIVQVPFPGEEEL